jgi:hypothetical protein
MEQEKVYLAIESREIPKPESFEQKEVYAFFGLASYAAQCLEKSLVNLAFTYHISEKEILSENEWDLLFDNINKNTFGKLLNIVKEQFSISEIILNKLLKSLKKRNWLAHDYFFDNATKFSSEKGREEMIAELSSLIELFNINDQYIEQIYMHIWNQLGLTEEAVIREVEKMKHENG